MTKKDKSSQATRDNRSRQLNPENPAYKSSRGEGAQSNSLDKASRDNRAKQLNPNNDAYWRARGRSKPKNG